VLIQIAHCIFSLPFFPPFSRFLLKHLLNRFISPFFFSDLHILSHRGQEFGKVSADTKTFASATQAVVHCSYVSLVNSSAISQRRLRS